MLESTFSDAIEQVMLNNGYYAPLSLIYKEFSKYREKTWLTPDKTIQERVQRDTRFTNIGLGIYALTQYLDRLPTEIEAKTPVEKAVRMHTHIQGMLIEIGNIEGFETYTPDRNGIFINRELWKIATLSSIPRFTYDKILDDSIRFVDVIWFNDRWFPEKLFEVENSTDFRAGFIKFNEIQDFRSSFHFVAPDDRKIKFETEKSKAAFSNIKDRCGFLNYDFIDNWYKNRVEGKKYNEFV
jgi:hypothetical protein